MSFYGSLYRNLFLVPTGFVRGRHYTRHSRFLETSQWWSSDELQAFQWREIQNLIRLAAAKVPYYQNRFKGLGLEPGDIKTWDDYRRLPVLTRQDIIEHREQLSSTDIDRARLLPHATGGSSGVPARFYRTIESYDWRIAATRRVYGWAGYLPGESAAHLEGSFVGKQPFLTKRLSRAAEVLARATTFSTFSQNEALWDRVYRGIGRLKPDYLAGYASSLLAFAQFIGDTRRPPLQFKGIVTAAESLTGSARIFISQAFNAPVFETYGSREFMSIGGECAVHNGFHVNAENLLVEAGSPDPLCPGEILITDLHNFGTVFIRYAIGDLGNLSGKPCQCGRGLPVLAQVQGRSLDTLTLRDGRRIPALFFCHILKDIGEILAFQIKQVSAEAIELRGVLSAELSPSSQQLLDSEMRKVLGDTKVALRRVSELEKSKSGKVKVVIPLEPAQPGKG